MNVHGRFRARHSSSRSSNFPDSVFPTNITMPTVPYIPDFRRDERTNSSARRKSWLVHFLRLFSATWVIARLIRVDIDGELFDDRTDIPTHTTRRSFVVHSIYDSWRPTADEKVYADMGSHICTGCCRYNRSRGRNTCWPRMNFDKIARISTDDRISARQRVWWGQFNEIQPGFRTLCRKRFFLNIRVAEAVGEWNRYIPRANDRLLVSLTM